MRGLKRFVYSVIGVTIFVILPGFFIVSIHMERSLPGKMYWVSDVSGRAFVQYQTRYPVTADRVSPAQFQKKSQWIPLQRGSKINSGALVKVDESAMEFPVSRGECPF